jgi:hypothetical protein
MKSIFNPLFFAIIFVSLIALCSCESDDHSKKVDVSGVQVNLKIHRFDQALFSIKPDSIPSVIAMLEKDFGSFFHLFTSNIIHIGESNYRDFDLLLQKFVTDFNMQTAYSDCQKIYKDPTQLSSDLESGFKYYKYYFTKKNVPEVYLYMGGFNQSIVTSENILGIGLEKYLGSNSSFYSKLGLPSYLINKMRKEYIVPDCFRAIAWSEFPYNDSIDNLAANMIYQGKVQYFIDLMLPDFQDSLKFGFTGKQLEWCKENEQNMWSYLIDKKQLFTTVQMDIIRYTDDAPFTPTFARESPGRTGVWLGWRMVSKYMELHPEVSLEQLMRDDDYQKIMNQSKYNP